jgi:hypothetical protein
LRLRRYKHGPDDNKDENGGKEIVHCDAVAEKDVVPLVPFTVTLVAVSAVTVNVTTLGRLAMVVDQVVPTVGADVPLSSSVATDVVAWLRK